MGHRSDWLLKAFLLVSLTTMWPNAAVAQTPTYYVTAGGGASFPAGGAGRGMNTGWLGEIMAGVTLTGNIVTLRLGGSYGQNRIEPQSGGNMMSTVDGGIDRKLGAMAGIMIMPDLDRDLIPYVLASAGVMHSAFPGSITSFAWGTGVGATLQTGIAAFYAECRFVRVRNGGGGDMIPLTAGIRIGN